MIWVVDVEGEPDEVFRSTYWVGMSQYLCLRISECLNPIFYNLGSSSIKSATFKLLRKVKNKTYGSKTTTRSYTAQTISFDKRGTVVMSLD